MRWFNSRKYQALLLTLLLILVVYPLLSGILVGRLVLDVLLLSLVYLSALLVVERRHWVLAVLLGGPAMVGLWTGYALPHLPPSSVALGLHVSGTLFLGFCVVAILRDIYREPGVSLDDVCGALCGYLLVGMMFGHLYCVIEAASPGSFQVSGASVSGLDGDRTHFLLVYFSLVTLTTVGYGDVVAVVSAARGLVVAEAVVGQLYMAVLIGELIGKRVSQVVVETEKSGSQGNSTGVASR